MDDGIKKRALLFKQTLTRTHWLQIKHWAWTQREQRMALPSTSRDLDSLLFLYLDTHRPNEVVIPWNRCHWCRITSAIKILLLIISFNDGSETGSGLSFYYLSGGII